MVAATAFCERPLLRFWRSGRGDLFLVLVLFGLAGGYMLCGASGNEAVNWCKMYQASDFNSFAKAKAFIHDLRVPIPVWLAVSEIVAYNLLGSTWLITDLGYRAALLTAFLLAIGLSASSNRRMLWSLASCSVFLTCVMLINPGSRCWMIYDAYLPFFGLSYIALLKLCVSSRLSRSPKLLALCCLAAGFCLSLMELTRPFVLFALPLLLFGAYQSFRGLPRKYFCCFLAPVALLSGGWHLHLAARDGQIVWSNHSGFNLRRAWPEVKTPPLVPESHNRPVAAGRLENLNTAEHSENNSRVQKAVFQYIASHPWKSAKRIAALMGVFVSAEPVIYGHHPKNWVFWLYRPLVWLTIGSIFWHTLVLAVGFFRYRFALLGAPENMLILMTFFFICFLAIGENGEQARFLTSVLPFLAALPFARQPGLFRETALTSSAPAAALRVNRPHFLGTITAPADFH